MSCGPKLLFAIQKPLKMIAYAIANFPKIYSHFRKKKIHKLLSHDPVMKGYLNTRYVTRNFDLLWRSPLISVNVFIIF